MLQNDIPANHYLNQASPFADRLKGLLKGFDSDPLASHKQSSQGSPKD